MAVANLATNNAPFKLLHLSPCIGTEVHGIDLRAELPDTTIDWLSDLLVERKVIFFRDQDLSIEEHIAFSKRFGDLEVHPFTDNSATHPELIRLGTLFANMEAAYDGLDAETQSAIASLKAVHDNSTFLQGMRNKGASETEIDAMREKYPPATHPVVRTHPVSGKKSLYVNKVFTQYIEGMEPAESAALLQKLCHQASIPDYQCRFRWQPNSIAFWDNRAAQHYAAADYWPEVRCMERVTVIGARQTPQSTTG